MCRANAISRQADNVNACDHFPRSQEPRNFIFRLLSGQCPRRFPESYTLFLLKNIRALLCRFAATNLRQSAKKERRENKSRRSERDRTKGVDEEASSLSSRRPASIYNAWCRSLRSVPRNVKHQPLSENDRGGHRQNRARDRQLREGAGTSSRWARNSIVRQIIAFIISATKGFALRLRRRVTSAPTSSSRILR